MPEVLGDAAICFKNNDIDSLKNALCYKNDNLAEMKSKIAESARKQVEKYSWKGKQGSC